MILKLEKDQAQKDIEIKIPAAEQRGIFKIVV
jgi:hypothetical protein